MWNIMSRRFHHDDKSIVYPYKEKNSAKSPKIDDFKF